MSEAAAVVIPVDFSPRVRPPAEADMDELLDPVHWSAVLEQYARTMNVAVVMVDLEGRWIGEAHNLKPAWNLVRKVRPAPDGERGFSLEPGLEPEALVAARETGACELGRDGAGQAHIVAPLVLHGQMVGALMAGQVFDRFPEQLALERAARKYGLPVVQLWEAARLQAPVSSGTLQVFGELLKNLGGAYLEARYSVILERERAAEIVALSRDLAERKRMEQRLRESESNLRLALKASGAVTWRWQPGAEILEWTSEFRELYGFGPEDAATFENWKQRVHPADLEPLLERLQRTLRATGALDWRDEFRVQHPDAGMRCFVALGRIARDAAGRATSVTGINFDITERRAAEEAMQRRGERLELLSDTLAQLLGAPSPDAVASGLFQKVAAHLGPHTCFTFSIRAEAGLRPQAWTDRESEDPRVARLLDLDRFISETVAATGEALYATDMQHVDFIQSELVRELGLQCYFCSPLIVGERFLGTLSFASRERPTFDEDDLRFVQIIGQYTGVALDRWRNTEQLTHAHELLGDRAKHLDLLVQQRTAKMQETIADLEAFSYSVAHDLRAPLRAMEGFADVVMEAPGLSTENTGYLLRIKTAAARLDRLTREVLSYSQMSRTAVRNQPIDLDRLAHDIVEQYPNLRTHKAHIRIESPLLPVLGQESLLMQTLANLMGNACKFVAPGQVPKVGLRTERRGEVVRITVEDSGIGIAPEHEQRLFRIFGRIYPEQQYEGTGIGLSIVKRATEKMGGSVGMSSTVGVGSAFWIELRPVPAEEMAAGG